MDLGTILFFKKGGQATKNYPLSVGENTIGSSFDADIRLKVEDCNLEQIHCVLDAKENGLVHLINKSTLHPVKVNGKPIQKVKVLYHEDWIELPGKSFQYLNENIDQETFNNEEKELRKVDILYQQRGVTSTKKIYKPKFSVYARTPEPRKWEIKKPLFSTPKPSVTINRSQLLASRSKTTSKVILTKARKSPTSSIQKKRRLSLGGHFAKDGPKISARNILLSTPTPKKLTSSNIYKTPKNVEGTPIKKVVNSTSIKTPLNKRVGELKQSGVRTPLPNFSNRKTFKKASEFESPKITDLAVPLSSSLTDSHSVSHSQSHQIAEFTKTSTPVSPSKRGRPSKKSTNSLVSSSLTDDTAEHNSVSHQIEEFTKTPTPITPSKRGRPPKKSTNSPVKSSLTDDTAENNSMSSRIEEFTKTATPVTPSKRGRPSKQCTDSPVSSSLANDTTENHSVSRQIEEFTKTPTPVTPSKRGRPSKKSTDSPVSSSLTDDTVENHSVSRQIKDITETPIPVSPSKRGRPPKATSTPSEDRHITSPFTPSKRGRPKKYVESPVINLTSPITASGRGRPKKYVGSPVINLTSPITASGRGRPKKYIGSPVVKLTSPITPSKRGRPKKSIGSPVLKVLSPGKFVKVSGTPLKRRKSISTHVNSVSPVKIKTPFGSLKRGRPRKSSSETVTEPFEELRDASPSLSRTKESCGIDTPAKLALITSISPSRRGRPKKSESFGPDTPMKLELITSPVSPSKRGRPKKYESFSPDTPAKLNLITSPVSPSKRGRPKKTESFGPDTPAKIDLITSPVSPSKRGRPKKSESFGPDTTAKLGLITSPISPSKRGRPKKSESFGPDTPAKLELITSSVSPSGRGRPKKSVGSPVLKLISPGKFTRISGTPAKTRRLGKSASTPLKSVSPVKVKTSVGSRGRTGTSVGTPANLQSPGEIIVPSVTETELFKELRNISISPGHRTKESVESGKSTNTPVKLGTPLKTRRSEKPISTPVKLVSHVKVNTPFRSLKKGQSKKSVGMPENIQSPSEIGPALSEAESVEELRDASISPSRSKKSIISAIEDGLGLDVSRRRRSSRKRQLEKSVDSSAETELNNVGTGEFKENKDVLQHEKSLSVKAKYASKSDISEEDNEVLQEHQEDLRCGVLPSETEDNLNISNRSRRSRSSNFPQDKSLNLSSRSLSAEVNKESYLSRRSRNTQPQLKESFYSPSKSFVVEVSKNYTGKFAENLDSLDTQENIESFSSSRRSRKSCMPLEKSLELSATQEKFSSEDAVRNQEVVEPVITTKVSRSSRRSHIVDGVYQSWSLVDESLVNVSHQRKSSVAGKESLDKSVKVSSNSEVIETDAYSQDKPGMTPEGRKSSRLSTLSKSLEVVEPLTVSTNRRSSRKGDTIEGFIQEADSVNVSYRRKSSVERKVSPNKSINVASDDDVFEMDAESQEKLDITTEGRNSSRLSRLLKIQGQAVVEPLTVSTNCRSSSKSKTIETPDQSRSVDEDPINVSHQRKSSVRHKVSPNKSMKVITIDAAKFASDGEVFEMDADSQDKLDINTEGRKSSRLSGLSKSQEVVEPLTVSANRRSSRRGESLDQSRSVELDPLNVSHEKKSFVKPKVSPNKSMKVASIDAVRVVSEEVCEMDADSQDKLDITTERNRRSSRRGAAIEVFDHNHSVEKDLVDASHQRKTSVARKLSPDKSLKDEEFDKNSYFHEKQALTSEVRRSLRGSTLAKGQEIIEQLIVSRNSRNSKKRELIEDLDQSNSNKEIAVNVSHQKKSSIGRKESLNKSVKDASKEEIFGTVMDLQKKSNLASESRKSSRVSRLTGQEVGSPNKSTTVASNSENFETNTSRNKSDLISQGRKSSRLSKLVQSNFLRLSKDFVVDIPKISSRNFLDSPSVAPANIRKSSKFSLGEPSAEIISRTEITPGSPLKLTGRRSYSKSKSMGSIPHKVSQSPLNIPERRSFRTKNASNTQSSDDRKSLVDQNDSSFKGKGSEEVFIISSSMENSSWRSNTDVSSRRTSRTSAKISQIFQENMSSSSTPYSKFKNSTALLSISDNNSSTEESTDDSDDELARISPVKEVSQRRVGRYAQKFPSASSRRSLSYSTSQSLSNSQDNFSRSNDVISISSTDDKENSSPSKSSLRLGKSRVYNTSASLRNSVQYEVKIERKSSRRINDRSAGHQEETSSTEERRSSLRRNSTTGFLEFTEETVSKSVTKRSARLIDGNDSQRSISSKASSTVYDDSTRQSESAIEGTPEVNGENVYEKEVTKSPKRSFLRKSFVNPNDSVTSSVSRVSGRKSIAHQPADDPLVSETPILTKTPARKSNVTITEPESSSRYRRSSVNKSETSLQLLDETPKVTSSVTPKSAVKPNRRSRSSFYNPITEEITPVGTPDVSYTDMGSGDSVNTPDNQKMSEKDSEFKTPINTPGLFESIIHSVIRSRKRGRESTGSALKSSKRRKLSESVAKRELDESQVILSSEAEVQVVMRPVKSPRNDLTDVRGVKKLLKTPRPIKSPRNSLSDVRGVKKLLRTPREVKSPKNDLTRVPNLRRMMSPKVQKSPRNDLTRVPNLKRMMSPKVQKSPQNDLTKIPNLRRLMSPKQQKSPKNDLSEVPNLRWVMSPKQSKEPENDLSDVSGVANMFNVSGVESLPQGSHGETTNTEELFNKLVGRPALRTYRTRSLSPKKSVTAFDVRRKTFGEKPVTSPRIEKWVEDQVAITAQDEKEKSNEEQNKRKKAVELKENKDLKKKKGVRRKRIMSEADLDAVSVSVVEEPPVTLKRTRAKAVQHEKVDVSKSTRSQKKVAETVTNLKKTRSKAVKHEETETGDDSVEDFDEVFVKTSSSNIKSTTKGKTAADSNEKLKTKDRFEVPTEVTRGRRKLLKNTEVVIDDVATEETQIISSQSDTSLKNVKVSGRSKREPAVKQIEPIDNEDIPNRGRGRPKKNVVVAGSEEENQPEKTVTKSTRGRRGQKLEVQINSYESTDDETERTAVKKTGAKAPRRKNGQAENENVEVIDDASVEDKTSVKKTDSRVLRGKKGQEKNDNIVVIHGTPVKESPPKKTRTRRGQKKENVVEDLEKINVRVHQEKADQELVPSSPVKKTTRARRGQKREEGEDEHIQKKQDQVAVVQQSSVTKLTRNTRGQKKGEADKGKEGGEVQQGDKNVQEKEEVETVRKRKADKDSTDDAGDAKGKTAATGRRKILANVNLDSPRPKRARRGANNYEDEEIIEVTPQEPAVLPKKTRGRIVKPQLDIEIKVDSPKPKSTRRGANTKVDEEEIIEGTPQGLELPKKAKERNVKQQRLQEIEVDVDSPRSLRSRRGVNTKYHESEYETTPIKDNPMGKKVTFKEDLVSGTNDMKNKKGNKRTRK